MFPELFKKASTLVTDNATNILTGLGITGVVTTAYFTGKASFKAAEVIREIEEAEVEGNPKVETTFDKVKLVWPFYIPAASVGVTTVTSIFLANRVASKKMTALAVASGISERALQEYKAKVIQKFGENKETQIRDEIAQDRINMNPPGGVVIIDSGNVLCYDVWTGRYFESSMEAIRQAENRVNADIINHNYASLSQFYDEIGLDPTPYSDVVGWRIDNLVEVQFSTVMSPDKRPCISIDFAVPPSTDYSMRDW